MLRAALFTALVVLATGPSSSLVCRVWCHSDVAFGNPCVHTEARSVVMARVANPHCSLAIGEAAMVIGGEGRRGPSAHDPAPVVTVAAFLSPPHEGQQTHRSLAGPHTRSKAAPPFLALRI